MPRHFSKQTFKNQARQESIDNHNLFTAFTHMIGLNRFFSFTPDTPSQIWRDEMKHDRLPNHHSK